MPYPIFNEAEAMERVGDKELLLELLHDFEQVDELDWIRFDQCLQTGNLESLQLISHSIKGMAGNLSLTGIYLTASALNDDLRNGFLTPAKAHYKELQSEVDRFREWLKTYA